MINAHARAQKDPFLAIKTIQQIPDAELQITHISVFAEALHIGLLVLATGMLCMLGQDHPDLFPVGDADPLA